MPAHVGAQHATSAEPLELALRQHPQELRLRRRGHFADLVEKQHLIPDRRI